MGAVKSKVRKFIVDNFLFGVADDFDDDTSFLDEGIIDSTGVLELVNFLEAAYDIQVDDEDLVPENLDSVNKVSSYVLRHTAQPASVAG